MTVEIAATELRDAYSYSLGLEYDSKVLRYIADSASMAVDGLLHVDPSGETALGRLDARFSRLGTSSGIDGAATLLTARFLTVGSGSTSVTVAEAELVDSTSTAWSGTDVATTAVLRVESGAESPGGGGAPGGAPQPETSHPRSSGATPTNGAGGPIAVWEPGTAPDHGEEASPLQPSETRSTKSPSEQEQGDGDSHAVDSDVDATAAARSEAGRDTLGSWNGWLIGLGAMALAVAIAAVAFRIVGARRATRVSADPQYASIDEEQDRT